MIFELYENKKELIGTFSSKKEAIKYMEDYYDKKYLSCISKDIEIIKYSLYKKNILINTYFFSEIIFQEIIFFKVYENSNLIGKFLTMNYAIDYMEWYYEEVYCTDLLKFLENRKIVKYSIYQSIFGNDFLIKEYTFGKFFFERMSKKYV